MKEPPIITLVLVIRNRPYLETKKCLDSLAGQDCKIILVDYGSDKENLIWERKLCYIQGIRLIEVTTNTAIFNKSRALNIGIRASNTKYVLVGDIDNLYQKNFISVVAGEVSEKNMVTCRRFNTDQAGKVLLPSVFAYGGCIALPRDWLFKVHGFDEKYTLWGAEDDDIMQRATQDGFKTIVIPTDATFCTHQWHEPSDNSTLSINRHYYKLKKPLIRNGNLWGQICKQNN